MSDYQKLVVEADVCADLCAYTYMLMCSEQYAKIQQICLQQVLWSQKKTLYVLCSAAAKCSAGTCFFGCVNDHTTHDTLLLTASYAQCAAAGKLDREKLG
jgi:hypothetical protein